MAFGERTWVDDEAGLREAAFELVRLLRRSLLKPARVFVFAVIAALAVGVVRARRETLYPARIVLRVIESDRATGSNLPRPKRHLREYVRDAVFSNVKLIEIIDRHKLYPDLYPTDPPGAVAAFREDTEIEVYRNYFVEDRARDDPTRSARIVVRYRAKDPKLAMTVAQELAELIVVHEAAQRREQAEIALRDATRVVDALRADLVRLKHAAPDRVTAPDVQSAEARLAEAERLKTELELNASAEQHQLALRFDIVDQAGARRVEPRTGIVVLVALLTLFLALPLAAIAVGAFDRRIRDAADVARLGLVPFGEVPAYPGDDVGSLMSRGEGRERV